MPLLLFAVVDHNTHQRKSASRMNTMGQVTQTSSAHVMSGHRHAGGNDHCHAPRPAIDSPSSGNIHTYSIEKFSLLPDAIIIAGSTYINASTSGKTNARTRSPMTASAIASPVASQIVYGGKYGVARAPSANAA